MSKTYVEVVNQKQWDFVTEKLNYNWIKNWFKENKEITLYINLEQQFRRTNKYPNSEYYDFLEWLQLNNLEREYNNYIGNHVEKSFEFDRWYKFLDKGLVYITSETTGYGWDNNGKWFERTEGGWNYKGMAKASDKEVKERLLEYIKEKYPLGTKFIELMPPKDEKVIRNYNFNYYSNNDQLTNGNTIYCEGKWAEIIKKPNISSDKISGELAHWIKDNQDFSGTIDELADKLNKDMSFISYTLFKQIPGNWAKNKAEYLFNYWNKKSINTVKKEDNFDRSWYIEVNSQEEANKVKQYLISKGENISSFGINKEYIYVKCDKNTKKWFVGTYIPENSKEKQLSDILEFNIEKNYIKGFDPINPCKEIYKDYPLTESESYKPSNKLISLENEEITEFKPIKVKYSKTKLVNND